MTKLETTIRQVSDLRDFYMKIKKAKSKKAKSKNHKAGTTKRCSHGGRGEGDLPSESRSSPWHGIRLCPQILHGGGERMKLHVIVHEAVAGGYWAEVPGVPGCATQGATIEELLQHVCEAVEGCLALDVGAATCTETVRGSERALEIEV